MNNTTLLNQTLQTTPSIIQTGVGALLILLAGLLIGKLAAALIKRLLKDLSIDKNINLFLNKRLSVERLIASAAGILIYLVTIILFLNTLGILKATLIIIGIITGALIAISILFSVIVDMLPNLLAGITLPKKKYSAGKKIALKNLKGTIVKRRLLSTIVKANGDEIVIPNKRFLKKE